VSASFFGTMKVTVLIKTHKVQRIRECGAEIESRRGVVKELGPESSCKQNVMNRRSP
jgi:hypothetical protein